MYFLSLAEAVATPRSCLKISCMFLKRFKFHPPLPLPAHTHTHTLHNQVLYMYLYLCLFLCLCPCLRPCLRRACVCACVKATASMPCMVCGKFVNCWERDGELRTSPSNTGEVDGGGSCIAAAGTGWLIPFVPWTCGKRRTTLGRGRSRTPSQL